MLAFWCVTVFTEQGGMMSKAKRNAKQIKKLQALVKALRKQAKGSGIVVRTTWY